MNLQEANLVESVRYGLITWFEYFELIKQLDVIDPFQAPKSSNPTQKAKNPQPPYLEG